MKKLLRVTTGHYCAGCVWAKVKGRWFACGPCAPILHWMLGLSPQAVFERLKRSGASWEWL